MSKDFTPQEQFWADIMHQDKTGVSLRQLPKTMTLKNGEEIRIDNHLAKERYPELSFLFNNFDELYTKFENDCAALEYLDKIEISLNEIEDEEVNVEFPLTSDEYEMVKKWFFGELDPNFYYSEINNEMFGDWITEQIDKLKEQSCSVENDSIKEL